MPNDAHLHSIDINDELKNRVQGYVDEANLSQQFHLHWGNALEIVPQLSETWDLVFIDADKENYLNYLNLVLPRLRPGGWIVADNVLWSGKVTQPEIHADIETLGLIEFTQAAKNNPDLLPVLFPIRDGLLVIQYQPQKPH
jgi:caffeoyl-CoA O-methyltransferase